MVRGICTVWMPPSKQKWKISLLGERLARIVRRALKREEWEEGTNKHSFSTKNQDAGHEINKETQGCEEKKVFNFLYTNAGSTGNEQEELKLLIYEYKLLALLKLDGKIHMTGIFKSIIIIYFERASEQKKSRSGTLSSMALPAWVTDNSEASNLECLWISILPRKAENGVLVDVIYKSSRREQDD